MDDIDIILLWAIHYLIALECLLSKASLSWDEETWGFNALGFIGVFLLLGFDTQPFSYSLVLITFCLAGSSDLGALTDGFVDFGGLFFEALLFFMYQWPMAVFTKADLSSIRDEWPGMLEPSWVSWAWWPQSIYLKAELK